MTELNRTPVETRPGWLEQYVAPADAAKRIRGLTKNRETGKNRKVYLQVLQHGKVDGSHYFEVSDYVDVGCTAACRYVERAYKGFAERGALVKLSWCDTIVFVG